jgi:hypothetical protein
MPFVISSMSQRSIWVWTGIPRRRFSTGVRSSNGVGIGQAYVASP